jgi:hypothetical protein
MELQNELVEKDRKRDEQIEELQNALLEKEPLLSTYQPLHTPWASIIVLLKRIWYVELSL